MERRAVPDKIQGSSTLRDGTPIRENPNMQSSNHVLRAGVVGAGAFGRNHARVYRDLQADPSQNVEFAGIADTDFRRAQTVASEFGTSAFRSIDELIAAGVQACSVAVPTAAHLEVARYLMQNGVDVLIEKPLATTVAEADELIALADRHGRIAQAGDRSEERRVGKECRSRCGLSHSTK